MPNLRHVENFAHHIRADDLLLTGVLEPTDGALVPDLRRPGHGLALDDDSADRYRIA